MNKKLRVVILSVSVMLVLVLGATLLKAWHLSKTDLWSDPDTVETSEMAVFRKAVQKFIDSDNIEKISFSRIHSATSRKEYYETTDTETIDRWRAWFDKIKITPLESSWETSETVELIGGRMDIISVDIGGENVYDLLIIGDTFFGSTTNFKIDNFNEVEEEYEQLIKDRAVVEQ